MSFSKDLEGNQSSAGKGSSGPRGSSASVGYAHATARENQLLAIDWGSLSPVDLQQIGQIVKDTLEREPDQARLEAVLAIVSVLVTGRPLEQVARFQIGSSAASLPEGFSGLTRAPCGWMWHLSVSRDAAKTVSGDGSKPSNQLIQPASTIFAICPSVVLNAVDACLALRGLQVATLADAIPLFSFADATNDLFEPGLSRLKENVRYLLKGRQDARSSTTTIASIERWLTASLAHQPGGDRAVASLLTGQEHDVSEVPRYYGVTPRHTLVASHARVVAGLVWTGHVPRALELGDQEFVGNQRTPTLEAVRRMASLLSQNIAARRGRRNPVRVHNAMVRYTAAMIAYGSGLRPHTDVVWRFDRASGFALVADKRVNDERTRIVPVPAMLSEQLSLYSEHLDELAKHLGLRSSAWLRDARSVGAKSGALPLFELADLDKPMPKSWRELCRDVNRAIAPDGPDNMHRHFLRTHLIGYCSSEAIVAMFGHWVVGTEPWSRSSGLDPIAYQADLEPRLERILHDAGFSSCPGLAKARARTASAAFALADVAALGEDRLPISSAQHQASAGHRAEPSPFNAWSRRPLPRTMEHYPALVQVIGPSPETREARFGQMLASAIYYGALLDPKWFKPWLEALISSVRWTERLWIEMAPADPDDPSHTYAYPRRWFADPVTEVLIRRWLRDFQTSDRFGPSVDPSTSLQAFFAASGNGSAAANVDDLLQRAEYRWRLQMPGVLVSYACGLGNSLSLPAHVWSRIERGKPVKLPPRPSRTASTAQPEMPDLARVVDDIELQMLTDALTTDPKKELESLLKKAKGNDLLEHLIRFCLRALHSRNKARRSWGQEKPYALSTLSVYVTALVKRIFIGDEIEIEAMDDADFDLLYRARFTQITVAGTRNKAINAVNLFHDFLCEADEDSVRDDRYEEFRIEGRVSTNVVSSSDYKRALRDLGGDDRQSRMMRLLLTLAFRTGLRLPELLGLKIGDISLYEHGGPGTPTLVEIYLRAHRIRRLKTEHSRRMLPLDALLTPAELDELRAWHRDHLEEARRRPNELLFASPGGGTGYANATAIRLAIESAIRRATGDPTMRYEHLRHSFASYLLACLLLPSDKSLLPVPTSLGDDCISHARRARVLARTTGAEKLGSSALHVVSQLCGHAPVTTTLRWYAHLLDWSLGCYVNREITVPNVSTQILQKVTGGKRAFDTAQRYDRKARALAADRSPTALACWDRYRVPVLVVQRRRVDDEVQLAPFLKSLVRTLKPVGRTTASTERGLEAPARHRAATAQVPQASTQISWVEVQKSVLALRSKAETADSIGRRLQVASDKVQQWLMMADRIAGPRRPGEKRLPFQAKKSHGRVGGTNQTAFLAEFPRSPVGASRDVVDWIWTAVAPGLNSADTNWALSQYCRYFSVDTGALCFLKIKDSKRFYRWLVENGFRSHIVVTRSGVPRPSFTPRPVASSADGSDGTVDDATQCQDTRSPSTDGGSEDGRLRKLLQQGLPAKLLDGSLKKIVLLDTDTLPRSLWIRIDAPSMPGARKASELSSGNNHSRYAVRFAFIMLAIASLKKLDPSPRRRGRQPGYGGHF